MSKYKKLYIERDGIIDVIKEYLEKECEVYVVSGNFKDFNGTQKRLEIKFDSKELYMDFYFNKDETTTIGVVGGNHIDVKVAIANYIMNSRICCLFENDDFKNSWYVVKNINSETVENIIELVSECDENSIIKSKEKYEGEYGPKWLVVGKYKEKVNIHYYDSKNKVMIQGKPRIMFSMFTNAFNELVDENCVVSNFNDFFKLEIEPSNIENQLTKYLPDVNKPIPDKLKKTLLQSVYNLNIDGEMFDYNFLTYPIFRGLEGHLRYVFKEHSIVANKTIGNEFDYNDNNKVHELKEAHRNSFNDCQNKIDYTNKVYRKLKVFRNRLFHWDRLFTTEDTTLMLSKEEARTHIIECFELINEYYTLN